MHQKEQIFKKYGKTTERPSIQIISKEFMNDIKEQTNSRI